MFKTITRDKFIKLLKLSASPSDGEALSCIRKINDLLRRENLTWERIFPESLEPAPVRKPKTQEGPLNCRFEECIGSSLDEVELALDLIIRRMGNRTGATQLHLLSHRLKTIPRLSPNQADYIHKLYHQYVSRAE